VSPFTKYFMWLLHGNTIKYALEYDVLKKYSPVSIQLTCSVLHWAKAGQDYFFQATISTNKNLTA